MADPQSPSHKHSSAAPLRAGADTMDTYGRQLSAWRGPPSPSLFGLLREALPETQSCYAWEPHGRPSLNLLFLTNYFTHLQDKLDFMRPIRTQTERRYAAEPQGQLSAV